jgi:hypothetical protein
MNPLRLYDGTIQMFIEAPREADVRHLRFLRWLAEQGTLEHAVAGPPAGSYYTAVLGEDRRNR